MKIHVAILFALPALLFGQAEGYRIDTVETPDTASFDVTGLDVAKDGRLYCATRLGEVWVLAEGAWTRFATGLHEPCGLVCDGPGTVVVAQKPEVTRLKDEDGDGMVDRFIVVADEFEFHDNYHEFNHGLYRDSKGAIYGALNLDHDDPRSFHMHGLGSMGGHRGTFYRISPGDKYETFAYGGRSPAGLGVSPKDELFYTDNQGNWVPSSFIAHVEKGSFQAEPTSLRDHPDFSMEQLKGMSDAELEALRNIPAVFLPHVEVANSPGNLTWDTTGGKFGPFEGQMFVVDHTQCNLSRVVVEKIGGRYQGAVIPFLKGFQSGNIRQVFDADGTLWVGQTKRGWGIRGPKPYGLQKVVWDGETVPFEILDISLQPDGFELRFTKPVNTEAIPEDVVSGSSWWYPYNARYGSPKTDEKDLKLAGTTWGSDGKSLKVRLELAEKRVFHLSLHEALRATDGSALGNRDVYYTLVHLK